MYHYFNIIKDTPFTEDEINTAVNLSTIGLLEDETKYITFENVDGHHVLTVELHRQLEEVEADDLVEDLELVYNKQGLKDFVIEISNNDANEETYIRFTLANNSNEDIPLIIPTVMNPNLSPNSRSGVDLRIGQEILFKSGTKKYVLLTVDENIENGAVLDVAKLLSEKKKELGLK